MKNLDGTNLGMKLEMLLGHVFINRPGVAGAVL